MLDDDSLQELGRHPAVPDTLGIDDDDRTARTHAETRSLPTFHAGGTEQQTFSLEQRGK
jgi:hypothetical protein